LLADRGKISNRQAIALLLAALVSPSLRFIPSYTSKYARFAAWVAPAFAAIFMFILVSILAQFFQKYKEASLMDVIYKITGGFIGRILVNCYCLWFLLLASLYTRYYAEGIVSSIMPNTSLGLFIGFMLLTVTLALHMGLVTFTRVAEILFPIFLVVYMIVSIFLFPSIKIEHILPVSYIDTLPILHASMGILSIWGYMVCIYFLGDRINNKENLKKEGFRNVFLQMIRIIILLLVVVGTIGPNVSSRSSLPFFLAAKYVSVFGVLERVESIVMSVWILSDFILITFFSYLVLAALKSICKLQDIKNLIHPLMILILFLSLYLANAKFELLNLSSYFIVPLDLIFEFLIPLLLMVLGKVRKIL